MKKIVIAIVILITSIGYSQTTQKKYKYILVPLQYGFTSEPNQFQLSVLTRVLLKEEGFEVYMSEGEALPNNIAKNQCVALKSNLVKDSGLLTTTLKFQLYDCFGKKVFESSGTSREKDFKEAYQDALRRALSQFKEISLNYLKRTDDEEEVSFTEIKEIEEIEETVKDEPFEQKAVVYHRNDKKYWLLEKDKNYILYLDKGETIYAKLQIADRGTYAFDSFEIDGAAYFNPDGDMIVEYLAKDKEAVQKLVFEKGKE